MTKLKKKDPTFSRIFPPHLYYSRFSNKTSSELLQINYNIHLFPLGSEDINQITSIIKCSIKFSKKGLVLFMHQNCMIYMEADQNPEGSAACCFCFSIKKKTSVARNYDKTSSSGVSVLSSKLGQVEWGKNDEILSDMSTFSVKEQERRLKKALEEEKKVSMEAERIAHWVKQESARIDVSTINSILSDHKEKD